MEDSSYTTQHNPPYRTAIVYALESVPPYRVRVQFPDRDNMISWWLPVVVPKIHTDKFFWQPDIGELVKVTMDEFDENGTVDGSIPSQVDAAPSGLTPADFLVEFQDGTTFHYNRNTHQMTLALGAGAMMTLSQPTGGKIELDSSGNVEIQAAASITFTQGSASASDSMALVSKLVAAFNAHTHPADGEPPSTLWTPATVSSSLIKASN